MDNCRVHGEQQLVVRYNKNSIVMMSIKCESAYTERSSIFPIIHAGSAWDSNGSFEANNSYEVPSRMFIAQLSRTYACQKCHDRLHRYFLQLIMLVLLLFVCLTLFALLERSDHQTSKSIG